MRLLSVMRRVYWPSRVTHVVVFFRWNWKSAAALSASTQLNRLLGLCFAAGLERSTRAFLTLAIHCWHYTLAQRRVPLFRYSSTGHLLRQVAKYNNWWARKNPASLSFDLKKHWKMAYSNARHDPLEVIAQYCVPFSLYHLLFLLL